MSKLIQNWIIPTMSPGSPLQEKRSEKTTIITRECWMPKPGRIDILEENIYPAATL